MGVFVSKWDSWEKKSPEVGWGRTDKTDKTSPVTQKSPEVGGGVTDKTDKTAPPPYPGVPLGAPFRPGQQVWLYRWDTQAPRFDAPVTVERMRLLWPGEQDIGWRNAAGELTWHNARLAVAVELSGVDARAKEPEIPHKEEV
jgi:hypothetical protein